MALAAGAVALPLIAYTIYRNQTTIDRPAWRAPDPKTLSKYPPGRQVYVSAPDSVIDPPLSEAGVASQRYPNIIQLLDRNATTKGAQVALRVEREGQWRQWTWADYQRDAYAFAKSLLTLGYQPNGAVAILGFNAPEWFIAYMGAIAGGGKGVGVYTTNGPETCQYVIDHSESLVVVVEDQKQLDKILKVQNKLPTVRAVVVYNDVVPTSAQNVTAFRVCSWLDFMKLGAGGNQQEIVRRVSDMPSGRCCSLIYTSGTTGNPKAVMMSHDNLVFVVQSIVGEVFDNIARTEDERVVSYLPLSHVAAQMLDIVMPLVATAYQPRNVTASFARPDALKGSLGTTLKAVRPTLFLGVPRVWEKIVEQMKAAGKDTKGLKLTIVKNAKESGLVYAEARQAGGSGKIPTFNCLWERLVYSKVREAVGLDKSKFNCTGAAPITRETLSFLASVGIDVYEVFGMSECAAAATWSIPKYSKWGSCGFAIPGVEVRIDHVLGRDKQGEGEIVFRGRNVMMGYMKEEQKTKEAIDSQGWLHSGDLGRIDQYGLLYITGRIKELIITAGGENIAPVPIEDELKRLMPGISNAMLVGDKRKFNIVLITLRQKQNLDTGAFQPFLVGDSLTVSPNCKTVEQAQNDPAWKKYIEDGIKRYNTGSKCVSNAQKIQKFAILPNDFSIPGDELTATLKLKRNVVMAKYEQLIDTIYLQAGGAE